MVERGRRPATAAAVGPVPAGSPERAVPAVRRAPVVALRRQRMAAPASPCHRVERASAIPTAAGVTIRDQRAESAASARAARGPSPSPLTRAPPIQSPLPAPARLQLQARLAPIRRCSAGTTTEPSAHVAPAKAPPNTQFAVRSIRRPGVVSHQATVVRIRLRKRGLRAPTRTCSVEPAASCPSGVSMGPGATDNLSVRFALHPIPRSPRQLEIERSRSCRSAIWSTASTKARS